MKIIKRNGKEMDFDSRKIVVAVKGANGDVDEKARLDDVAINGIAVKVTDICSSLGRAVSVEEVQDMVENQIMSLGAFELARAYITYRYERALARKSNSTDDQILSLIEFQNQEVKEENSNKAPEIASVQRDYMAGEVSKDLTKRILLPKEIWEAHEAGIIHFHETSWLNTVMCFEKRGEPVNAGCLLVAG